jgi:cytochrome c553
MRRFFVSLIAALSGHALLAAGAALAAGPSAGAYDTNCSLCHQAGGVGATAQFPRLAGRVSAVAMDKRGRAYLVHVVHNGLSGTLTIDGAPLTGVMPPQPQLSAQDIAQILNYLITLSPPPGAHPKSFSAAEVTSLTAATLTRDELLAERQTLVEAKVLP